MFVAGIRTAHGTNSDRELPYRRGLPRRFHFGAVAPSKALPMPPMSVMVQLSWLSRVS